MYKGSWRKRFSKFQWSITSWEMNGKYEALLGHRRTELSIASWPQRTVLTISDHEQYLIWYQVILEVPNLSWDTSIILQICPSKNLKYISEMNGKYGALLEHRGTASVNVQGFLRKMVFQVPVINHELRDERQVQSTARASRNRALNRFMTTKNPTDHIRSW